MRTIILVELPLEPFNTAVRNGTVGATMKKILDEIRPEAAYFTEIDGCRTAVIVADVPTAADIPRFAEPWFLSFNAAVKFRPAMTFADLAQGDLDGLGKKWS